MAPGSTGGDALLSSSAEEPDDAETGATAPVFAAEPNAAKGRLQLPAAL